MKPYIRKLLWLSLITLSLAFAPFARLQTTHAQTVSLCSQYPPTQLPLLCGEAATTHFSGFNSPYTSANYWTSGLNLDAPVVTIFDIRNPAANSAVHGQGWCPPKFENGPASSPNAWTARNLGQVFGVTLDDNNPPNIYVAATTTYGSDKSSYQVLGATAAFASSPFPASSSLNVAGRVYRLDGQTGAITVFAELPNHGPALGNICFDQATQRFFVSNFEDGRIYCLDTNGNFVSTFNFATGVIAAGGSPTGAEPDGQFAPRGRRPWAVQAYNGALFFSIWTEDVNTQSAATDNEIWSINISSGSFSGPAKKEIPAGIPHYSGNYSNPVSDINFSPTGHMMLAERVMRADVGTGALTASGADAHLARNLDFVLSGTQWVASGQNYFIGEYSAKTNAEGGIDFDCSGNLVSTGDGLLTTGLPGQQFVYGLQITPAGGNTLTTVVSSGYAIDFDGISTVQSKHRLGDVAVRRDCCQCADVTIGRIECDLNSAGNFTLSLNVTNNTGTTVGSLLINPSVGTFTVAPASPITLTPPLLPGQTTTVIVTLGNGVKSGNCLKITLIGFTFVSPSHDVPVRCCCTVEVCIPLLPPCDCAVIRCSDVNLVSPGTAGTFSYTFCVTNLTPQVIEDIYLYPPPGVTFTPSHFDVSVPPNMSFCGTVTITGAAPGSQLCFGISLHDQNFKQCCAQRPCITLPRIIRGENRRDQRHAGSRASSM